MCCRIRLRRMPQLKHSLSGRLGPTTQTQFTFAPIKDFAHQASSIVLSPDHTVIVTTAGDVYTFGLNRFQQLGYALDSPSPAPAAANSHKNSSASDEPIQSNPRRVVGALKKEVVLGAAASRTHTAVFTADSLYTWGTNRGQLGYPAAGTAVQVLPRKVTLVSQPVIQLTATENATACLLESRDVVVLYHEAYLKIAFPLTPFPSKMQTYRPPRVGAKPNIRKVASCGNTFAALSSLGDVFTFTLDSGSSTSSAASVINGGSGTSTPFFSSPDGTSSPGSALARLTPRPQRIWNLRRKFTAVTDVGVGLDGTIIICTVSGHVFLRSKKYESSSGKSSGAMTPSASSTGGGGYKFTRVPYLQRVIKVAANSTGGFSALRADVPLRFIEIEGATLARDLLSILPHWQRVGPVEVVKKKEQRAVAGDDDPEGSEHEDDSDLAIERDVEVAKKLAEVAAGWDLTWEVMSDGTDAVIKVGLKSIPVHRTVLASRSQALATKLESSRSVDLDCAEFTGLLFVHYLYSDDFPAIWDTRIGVPLRSDLPPDTKVDYGVIKAELRQLARDYDLPALSDSLERQVKNPPASTLPIHLVSLLHDAAAAKASGFSSARGPDVLLLLSNRNVAVHSAILRARCPFFTTFFADPVWSSKRKEEARGSQSGVFELDLRHLDSEVMDLVLEHIYKDAGMSLFHSVHRSTSEEFIDLTVKVLAAANELLLDKLKQVCSAVLRSFGASLARLSLAVLRNKLTGRFCAQ